MGGGILKRTPAASKLPSGTDAASTHQPHASIGLLSLQLTPPVVEPPVVEHITPANGNDIQKPVSTLEHSSLPSP